MAEDEEKTNQPQMAQTENEPLETEETNKQTESAQNDTKDQENWSDGLKTSQQFLLEARRAEKAKKAAAKAEKKKRKAENKKRQFSDDGHTISEMNVEGMPFYEPNKPTKEQVKNSEKPTKKETFAMIMGAYKAYLPTLLFMVGIFTLVFLAAYFFLRSKY